MKKQRARSHRDQDGLSLVDKGENGQNLEEEESSSVLIQAPTDPMELQFIEVWVCTCKT